MLQGAATSIESEESGEIVSCKIEIPSRLKNSKLLTRLYSLDEILCHEWIHCARASFNCSQFEEIIAYHTSKSSFRRKMGPFFDNTALSKFFVGCGFTLLFIPLISFLLPVEASLAIGTSLYAIFASLFSYKALKLSRNLKIFKKCLRILERDCKCKKRALSLIVALTDEEIQKTSATNSIEWVLKEDSLRHKLIHILLTSQSLTP